MGINYYVGNIAVNWVAALWKGWKNVNSEGVTDTGVSIDRAGEQTSGLPIGDKSPDSEESHEEHLCEDECQMPN